jgi:DsbC/DsbD-like thiol-disulfide interchange protein
MSVAGHQSIGTESRLPLTMISMVRHGVSGYVASMRFARSLATSVALLALCGIARAESSAWSEDMKSAIRLTGGEAQKTPMQAGVEMKLAPGWHTYWRYPGDSGVPPEFDFSGSDNLKSATVLYPAPKLHKDAGGETIGYDTDVIFPVDVTPQDASRPVMLKVSVDYAVCENMCVPAKGQAELVLKPGTAARNTALADARARVPKRESAQVADLHLKRVGEDQVIVDFAASSDAPVSVFAEGRTKDWALPIPQPVKDAAPGRRAFAFKLDGLPPGTDPKKAADLTFTIVQGARALEVPARLD